MPGRARVWNGSKGKSTNGLWLSTIIGVTENGGSIIPAYSELYSLEVESTSENQKIIKGNKAVHNRCRSCVITVLDRGGDRRKLFEPLLDEGIYFTARLTKKRHLLYKGKRKGVYSLVKKIGKPFILKGVSKKKNHFITHQLYGGACRVALLYENEDCPYKGKSL